MNREVNQENIAPGNTKRETGAREKKTPLRKRILGWLGYLAVFAASPIGF